MKTLSIILAGCLILLTTGCEGPATTREQLIKKIDTITHEKTELIYQLKRAEAEKEELKDQIKTLSELPVALRLEHLQDVQKVKVTRFTNLYDKDKDGKREMLIVYIQPSDQQGDIIKASGTVDVQLWDLEREATEALIGQWHTEPEELRELWFATVVTTNYRLNFDVSDKIDEYKTPLTVKVTFTDYLTGKVFKEQKVIKP